MPRAARTPPRDHLEEWPGDARPGRAQSPQLAAVGAAAAVAANVARLRAERGVSQLALAPEAGLSVQTLNAIEAGRVWCDIESLARLAYALGVEPWELLKPA